ncbi:DegV family protein [Luteimonas vadosa]|uniref:DegV family protein n=2 Tax=Luteimonas vadosa TaxID=1165507 RepID=A0ABP9DQP7_9GAMM
MLRRALVVGAQRVVAGREHLNRINVFPVADGDTGNNLAFTFGALLNGALAVRRDHLGEMLLAIGEEAIDGARGNSGAILAQFLHGVAEDARRCKALDATGLAAAVGNGARQARGALANPVEGTMLSVMDRFAEALRACTVVGEGSPRMAFLGAMAEARRALADTTAQMSVLQRAGVVDAGARGFVDLLEGIAEYAEAGQRVAPAQVVGPVPSAPASHGAEEAIDPSCRWCTECLLIGEALDRRRVGAALEALGADSVVLAGGATRLRVHAHVGAPQALFDACAGFGAVEGMKADDMLLQARSVASGSAVAVATDSAADLPAAIVERHGLHVVPVRVNVGGCDYLDKVGLATSDFYRRMEQARELPRTSQPPPGDFRRVFDFLAAHHAEVVYVGLSGAVSGTLQSAEHAAARVATGGIRVFDSLNAAGGQALLAWRAAELAEAGQGAEAILLELERLRPITPTWAMARDITHAVRGGRIPAWAAPAVRWTGLTPVARIRPDGRLAIAGGLFAKARAPEAFAAYVARRAAGATGDWPGPWRAIIGHCDARAGGERMLDALQRRLDLVDPWLVETGPALGAHAGRGTLVVSLQPFARGDRG